MELTLDRDRLAIILADWEPGEDVDRDSLIEGALHHLAFGGPVPPELAVGL